MESIDNIYPELGNARKIVITCHQKPDGDAFGSSLGLAHFLRQFGHQVQVISPTNWAKFLDWMPGTKDIIDYEKDAPACDVFLNEADWIFCLDFNTLSRTKNMEVSLLAAPGKRILIDHHQQPQTEVFAYGISNTKKSSTCEMVFDFINQSGNLEKISKDVATCLYTGVMTDTGSFRYPATTPSVHTMVSALMERGMDHSIVHNELFGNQSENRLRFLGNALLNRMEVFYVFNTALISIPAEDLKKYDIKTGDTEGMVNYPLGIEGIKMAAIIIDRTEVRKWSFRSRGDFDVNVFARKYFDGGGHIAAAGGQSQESFEAAIAKFKKALEENRDQLTTYNF